MVANARIRPFDNDFYNTLNRKVTYRTASEPSQSKAPKPAVPASVAKRASNGAGIGGPSTTSASSVATSNAATDAASAADRVAAKTANFKGYTQPSDSGISKIKQPKLEYGEQDVDVHLNRLLDRDGEYMQIARKQGVALMGGRGLSNSTMAVQAGEASARETAFQVASQNASQWFQRNLQNDDLRYQSFMQMRDLMSREAISRNEIQSAEAIAYANALTDLEQTGMQLSSEERQLVQRIQADKDLEATRQAGEDRRFAQGIERDYTLQQMGDDAAMDRLRAEFGFTARENARDRSLREYEVELGAETTRRGQDIERYGVDVRSEDSRYATDTSFQSTLLDNDTRERIAELDASTRTAIADADRAMEERLRDRDLDQKARDGLSTGYANAVRSYASITQGINTNTAIKAAERQDLLDTAYSDFQADVIQTYAIWDVPLPAPAASAAPEPEPDPRIGGTGLLGGTSPSALRAPSATNGSER